MKKMSLKDRVTIKIKKSKPYPLWVYLCICVILFIAIFFTGQFSKVNIAEASEELESKDNQFRMTICGDIEISDNTRKLANNIKYKNLFKGMTKYWKDSDYVMANVSGPVLRYDADHYISTREPDEESFYLRPAAVRGMAEAGINLLSFANDDVFNYGTTGINSTLSVLEQNSTEYLGIAANNTEPMYKLLSYGEANENGEEKNVAVISVNDVVMKRSSATEERAGVLDTSVSTLYEDVYELSVQSEYLIAYIHFSDEKGNKVTEEQSMVAHALIDAGADLVVGNSVNLKRIERYNDGVIVYSLGSLITDNVHSDYLDNAILDFVINKNGDAYIYVSPVRIKNGQPEITQNGWYIKRIHSLLTKGLEEEEYQMTDDKVEIFVGDWGSNDL